MTLDTLLAAIYDSEINIQISSFWDGGWRVEIGDELNGHTPMAFTLPTIESLKEVILAEVLKFDPTSDFAFKYNQGLLNDN